MSKYLIEFDDDGYRDKYGDTYFNCKQIKCWSVPEEYIRKLTPIDESEQGSERSKPMNEARINGMNELWEYVKAMLKMDDETRAKIFGNSDFEWIANNYDSADKYIMACELYKKTVRDVEDALEQITKLHNLSLERVYEIVWNKYRREVYGE
ncbi:MAG: hypothetical protein IKN54_04440 [Lachnospiraceae bacterium]|nr:hypothetical protein [Lachnospiraceae bacterium]